MPLNLAALPRASLLTVLTGGSHPVIDARRVELQVRSAVLVAIAQWTRRRQEFISIVEEIERSHQRVEADREDEVGARPKAVESDTESSKSEASSTEPSDADSVNSEAD